MVIQPLGSFDSELLDTVSSTISQIYHFKVSVLPSMDIPKSTFTNQKSPRYRADQIIGILKDTKPDSIDYVMGFIEKDISTTKRDINGNTLEPVSKYQDWGVFGLGYRPGVSSVVSTYRFRNSSEEKFTDRLLKISIHELGHNLGLKHCPDKKCVMTDAAESIKTIDHVRLSLCETCSRKID